MDDLKELRALGYDGITFGVETGNDEAPAVRRLFFFCRRAADTIRYKLIFINALD